jgi:hypothetical protein
MDMIITTYRTLYRLVNHDTKIHKQKDLADLFLNAMNDWPSYNQNVIGDFVKELKNYFGSQLTIKDIDSKKFNLWEEFNTWRDTSGSSIAEMIEMSTQFCNESDFDKILMNILNYYGEEFSKVDFIAELKYRTTEEGGRKTAAFSGIVPQLKFEFTEKQSGGRQIFIDKEIVHPGEAVKTQIKVLSPDFYINSLTEGMLFEIREGNTVTATGQILEIINDKLEKNIN